MSWWPLRSLKTAKVSEERRKGGRGRGGEAVVSFLSLSQKMRRSRRRLYGS